MICRFTKKEVEFLQTMIHWVEVLVDTPNPDHVTAWLKRQESYHGVDIKTFGRKLDRMPEPFLRTLFGRK